MTENENFIPEDYKQPSSGGVFMKLEDGKNTIRVLSSKPVFGWSAWQDGECTRYPYSEKPSVEQGEGNGVNHFWGLVVYDYADDKIKILELDKKSVQNSIIELSKDDKWGHPTKYDIIIKKSGSGKNGTKYDTTPLPPAPMPDEVQTALSKVDIDVNNWFSGDPIIREKTDSSNTETKEPKKSPTKAPKF
jgi:hypothetical protein